MSRTDAGESGSGRTDTGRTDTGRADGRTDANRTDAADRPSTDRPDASRPDGSEPHDRRQAAWRTGPSGQATGSPRDADAGDDSRPGGRTGLGIAGAAGAAAGAAAAGMAAGRTDATAGPGADDRGPNARPGTPTPSGSAPSGATPRGESPATATPFGRYPSGATPSGGFPSSTNPPDAGQTGANQTGEFPAGARPSGTRHTGEFPAGTRPSDAGQSGGWPSRAAAAGAPGGGQSGADQSGAAAFGRGGPADRPGDTSQGTAGGPGTAGAGGWGAAQGFSGPGVQSTGGHTPSWGPGAQSTGGHAPWGRGDQADDGQAGSPGARPGDTGGYAARSFADGDAITPATGAEALPRRIPGPPSPTGPGPQPAGPYRTDQQAPHPEQYRSVGGTGGFPPSPAQSSPPPSRVPDPADELFAPRVPSLDPDGQLPGHDPNASAFDLGETTPIFEEIASAWFRSNRPVPGLLGVRHRVAPRRAAVHDGTGRGHHRPNGVTRTGPSDGRADGWGQSDRSPVGTPADGWPSVGRPAPWRRLGGRGRRHPAVDPARRPVGGPAVRRAVAVRACGRRAAVGAPTRIDTCLPGRPPGVRPGGRRPRPAPAPRQPEPTPADFSTEADEGWLAASGAVADRPDELTAAGLPKRRPRARLIPGSAGSAVLAPAVTAARSAESIRGRLASYQQGVRQGRRPGCAATATTTPRHPQRPGADHDEESS